MLAARAFEPEFLKRLDRLVLGIKRARTSRHGPRTLGRVQGIGIELESFKDYVAGDDLRFLDWNAMARLDELFTKSYRAEREIEISIMVDTSGSMTVPSGDDKQGLAWALGAGLAYLGMSENDAVRLVAFGPRQGKTSLLMTDFHRRRESYAGLKDFVLGIKWGGETGLLHAVEQLLARRRQPGMVIVISDFLIPASEYEAAFSRLLGGRNEVKAVQVLGTRESAADFPAGPWRLRDSETGAIREVTWGTDATAIYRRKLEQVRTRLREFCNSHAITYAPAEGAEHLDDIIMREFPRLGLVR
jgi:uncharacterized protein (DUF58 family)